MRLLPYLAILLSWTYALPGLDAQIIIRHEEPIEFKADEIGVDQGLSQGMVHGLVTDRQGYVWIGTKDGLNRYDGNHFHVFRNDPRDPHSIASNYILSLHVDGKGMLWVGTSASGLDLYNPSTASFIHFGKEINQFGKSTIKSIIRIISDPNGRILIWDGNGERAEMLIPITGKDPYSVAAWEIKPMRDIYPSDPAFPNPNSNSMLGFSNDGALLYSEKQTLFFLYPDTTRSWQPSQTFDLNNLPAIKAPSFNFRALYFMDRHRRLYCINPKDRLLYIWDTKAGQFTPQMQLPESFPYNLTRFFVDDRGRIWCKSATSPLFRIDPEQGIYQELRMHAQVNNANPVVNFDIRTEDDHHNLWGATSGKGLVRISASNDMFTRQPSVGDENRDFYIIENGKSYNVDERFDIHAQKKLRDELLREGLIPVSTYAKDAHKQLWCLAVNSQPIYRLVRIQLQNFSYSSWPIALNQKPVQDNNMEGTIMIDRHGIMWGGAECSDGKALLFRITSPESTPEIYTFPLDVIRNEHPFISDWYVDDDNVFWIGTKQGLFVFNPATSQWKHFHVDAGKQDALSNNHILSICPDPKTPEKYLWIGTDGGGLNRLDIKTETFNHYTTENGLPNNVIYGVQHDTHGQLWMSTNFGLCRFDPETAAVWSFTVDDGLMGNEFNRLSYGKDIHGRLYFDGVEGLTIFDPEVFYSPAEASPIVINRLKLSNKEVVYTSAIDKEEKDSYILPAPIEQCQKLSFPYTERMITLGFSLLDFTNPKGNKYRYKLEGFNDDWIEAGAENEAVFTNLNPGKYTFLVSGSNSQNVWSAPAQMQLTILSPWWATWWFRSLLGVIIAAGIYGFYKYRLQQTIKLQHLRNRIAADLHDEIGSTLSSISLAGTVIQHKLKNSNPEVEGFLQKINYNTQKMMEAMSDIVWAVNTKNDRFEQVLHRMRAFAVEILEPKEVMIHFDASPHISQLLLDMQQRKNLYLIFKEVIHNAAKYADCKNVWVTLGYSNGRLLMKVRDDGVGFDLKPAQSNGHNEFGGNGIHNMYHRAHELKGKMEMNSSTGQGTEVLLSFVV